MGDTGEVPLLIKGYRLMINFWHRIRGLPADTLVKKALLENTIMRSNWIITIEKLLNVFGIQFMENNKSFKAQTKTNCNLKYKGGGGIMERFGVFFDLPLFYCLRKNQDMVKS